MANLTVLQKACSYLPASSLACLNFTECRRAQVSKHTRLNELSISLLQAFLIGESSKGPGPAQDVLLPEMKQKMVTCFHLHTLKYIANNYFDASDEKSHKHLSSSLAVETQSSREICCDMKIPHHKLHKAMMALKGICNSDI